MEQELRTALQTLQKCLKLATRKPFKGSYDGRGYSGKFFDDLEAYFHKYGIPEDWKLEVTRGALTDLARDYYEGLQPLGYFPDYSTFKESFTRCFFLNEAERQRAIEESIREEELVTEAIQDTSENQEVENDAGREEIYEAVEEFAEAEEKPVESDNAPNGEANEKSEKEAENKSEESFENKDEDKASHMVEEKPKRGKGRTKKVPEEKPPQPALPGKARNVAFYRKRKFETSTKPTETPPTGLPSPRRFQGHQIRPPRHQPGKFHRWPPDPALPPTAKKRRKSTPARKGVG